MDIDKDYADLYGTVLKEHREVFERQDRKALSDFLSAIERHGRVFVMGVGREGIAARGFAMRLMHLGKETHWIWDDTTPGMGPEDLFIAVNGSSNIGHINYVIERARDAGAEVVVVTGSPSGKAGKLASSVFFVPAAVFNGTDPVVPSVQPMGNLFEQHLFMLFDIAIMLLEKRLKVTHEEMASRHRNVE